MAKTVFEKIWESHVVAEREDGQALLYIDLQIKIKHDLGRLFLN